MNALHSQAPAIRAQAHAGEFISKLQELSKWLRNEADKTMKYVKGRRDSAAIMEKATVSELRNAKATAELMHGHKLRGVKTDIKSNLENVRMDKEIANKDEIKAHKFNVWADAIDYSLDLRREVL